MAQCVPKHGFQIVESVPRDWKEIQTILRHPRATASQDDRYLTLIVRLENPKEEKGQRKKTSSEKMMAGCFRKRRGESRSFLVRDADQES
ncbi:hypothetical protein TNCV_635901 [Trichonephila clavipes]|nr:hypothetical protein TNCV_635901 [Trichonephila clavipes]